MGPRGRGLLPLRLAVVVAVCAAWPSYGLAKGESGAAEMERFEATLGLLPPGARPRGREIGEPYAIEHDAFVESLAAEDESASARRAVEYTVNPELETRVRATLFESDVKLGHVILMDPATGEIYAYVSTDPARFPGTRTYPMASLMKVVTAAAALRHSPQAARRDCSFTGSRWELHADQLAPPAAGHGRAESFVSTLAMSNNPCFARLAIHTVGEAQLLAELEAAGLLDPPAPMHAPGRAENPSSPMELGHLGSGMAGMVITPLAAVRLAAALAHGELVEPYWIASIRDQDGRLEAARVPERARPLWSPELLERLRPGLLAATESGTAARAFRDARGRPVLGPIRVAGKTGTVSGTNPKGEYQWFIGIAPADAPQVAIATLVVDDRQTASSAAAVAAATLRSLFCESGVCDASRGANLAARARARRDAFADEIARRDAPPSTPPAATAASGAHEPPEGVVLALDEPLRPLGDPALEFPRRLLRKKASGRVVLLLTLSPEGRVVRSSIETSDLPEFNEFVTQEVAGWSFTPPRRGGRPVVARALLPIPIRIE